MIYVGYGICVLFSPSERILSGWISSDAELTGEEDDYAIWIMVVLFASRIINHL